MRKTTGKYSTRNQLEKKVQHFFHNTDRSVSMICVDCGISSATVYKIVKKKDQ